MDNQNNVLQEANPSDAIQVIGWKDLPQAGQEFLQVSSYVIVFKYKNIIFYSVIQSSHNVSFDNCYYAETCTGSS